jgi:hypothetical protein
MMRNYQMTVEGQEAATLRFVDYDWMQAATAVCAQGSWTFTMCGISPLRVAVRAPGSDIDLGVFVSNFWGGGTLFLPGDRSYVLKPLQTKEGDWVFEDSLGTRIIAMYGPRGIFKHSGVIIVRTADSSADIPLLALLIWYLRRLNRWATGS